MDTEKSAQLFALINYAKGRGDWKSNPVDASALSNEELKTVRFQTLVTLVLSARTKDATAEEAAKRLGELDGGLCPKAINNATTDLLQTMIHKVNSYIRKSRYIKIIASECLNKYEGDIPRTIEDLKKLPGVGIKTAILAMEICWKKSEGIGVDTHVHRVSNRLNFVKTNTPESTETELQKIISKEKWADASDAMYHFGQEICTSRKPKCDSCFIVNCPYKFLLTVK